jgi:hypothetical protein
MCKRLSRPVPLACDLCAWNRITRALGDDIAMDVAASEIREHPRRPHG